MKRTGILGSAAMRLAAALSLIFTLATLSAGGVSYVVLSRGLKDRLADDARQMAENLAATYQVAGLIELHAQIQTNVATTRDYSNLYLFADPTGQIVFGNFGLRAPFTGPRELVEGVDIRLRDAPDDIKGAVFAAHGVRVPAGWIITARDTRSVTGTQAIVFQSIVLGLAVALVLSVALAMVFARRSERRLARLERMLEAVAEGDLSLRFRADPKRPDDISRVADKIDEMLDRLALSVDSLRQVSNDVAHDLRTPLMRLRSRLEPLLRHEATEDEARAAVEELDAIQRTFNAILRIAQIEGGNAHPRREQLDLGELAETVHEMLEPVAEEMGHTLTLDAHPTPVEGDREMLAQALTNLVENALRHCPESATISISTGPGTVTVCDNGPGIPEVERDRVTRRFYRLEASRNTPGSGLGLSLVQAIARLHGGQLDLSDNAPGLCARIVLAP
ncbi:MAG: ATP-binding protein [Brevirhabdus sp.]